MHDLLRRRLPQIVAVTIAVGLGVLGSLSNALQLRDSLVFRIALVTFGYSILVAFVLAWFHGKPGRQRVRWLEVGLLAMISILWLVTCITVATLAVR